MPKVTVRKNESIQNALRRFKKQCKKEALVTEMKKRRSYIKPSERRRKKSIKAQRRSRRGN